MPGMRGMRKTALVTGATSGIGAEFARALAERKCDLIITGRRKDQLRAIAEQLTGQYGVTVDTVILEFTDVAKLVKFCRTLRSRTIDILVNNAGFGIYKHFQEATVEENLGMVEVHDSAVIRLTHAVLPGMIERKSGTIINVASQSAMNVTPKCTVYAASKAFAASFSEGLYLDLHDTGIVVQALCPGLTHTDFHEKIGMGKSEQQNRGLMRWMEPEQIVRESLAHAERNTGRKHKTVICIPGSYARWTVRLTGLLPKFFYYRLVNSMIRKYR